MLIQSSVVPDSINMLETLMAGYVKEPWLQTSLTLSLLLLLSWIANFVAKKIVLKVIVRLLNHLPFDFGSHNLGGIVARLSNIVPAFVIQIGIGAIPHLPIELVSFIRSACIAFTIMTIAIALAGALNLLNILYQMRPNAHNRPIKGYVQVVKLIVYAAAIILAIAALMNQSPLLLLSGLGAMAAVLMLVFKDTLLSLVASVQIGSNDMIRVGDWIEMPQLNADGDVIDIALHTVKVQNFDKTITTIPTYRLINESFRNWRGMAESGGRRIKRSLMIDQNSVHFLGEDQIQRLHRFTLLDDYLDQKEEDIQTWNSKSGAVEPVNARRLTNIGTFRAYVVAYLKARNDIAKDKTILVRQMAPGEFGLPLEIYVFTATTAWGEYEDIQGDIFDHLIAILPEFGLRLFQRPTGLDFVRNDASQS